MLTSEMIRWIPNYLSRLPLHSQLAKMIRYKISGDILVSGHVLPSYVDIGTNLGVPAQIIRSAYAELQEDGLGILQANGTFRIGGKSRPSKLKMIHTKNLSRVRTGRQ